MIWKRSLTISQDTAKSWSFAHKWRRSKALWALLTLVLIVLTGPITTGWVAPASAEQELVMATSADFPPYEYHATVDGVDKIVGFDIDIANYITAQLGFNLTIKDQSFDTLIPSLQSGQPDFVMAGLNATPERRELVDFSDPYYYEFFALISRAGKPVTGLEDLAGRRLGVQRGSTAEPTAIELKNTIKGLKVVTFDRLDDLVAALLKRRLWAGLTADEVARSYVDLNPSLQYVQLPSLGELITYIAFPKGSTRVNDFNGVLAQMQNNGELARLVNKWFNGEVPISADEPA